MAGDEAVASGAAPNEGPPGDDPEAVLAALTPRLRELDDAPAPEPSFVTRLEEALMDQAGYATPMRRPFGWNGHAEPGSGRAIAPPPPRSRLRWPVTELAVVAVVLLTIAVGFAGYRTGPSGPGADETRVSALQDGTPAAAECSIAPRAEEVLQGEGTPAGLSGTPAANIEFTSEVEPNPYGILEIDEEVLPIGDPAPDAAVAGMRSTLLEFAACEEAGEFERQLALFSDDYFRRPEMMANGLGFPPLPQKISMVEEIELRDARLLPGGRVGAIVDSPYAATFFLVAVEGDERWLIDESVLIFEIYGRDGTPAPEGPGVGVSASCGARADAGTAGPGTPAPGEAAGQIVIEGRIVVSAGIVASANGVFVPGELEMAANRPLSLLLLNCGDEAVGFVIDELAVNLTIRPGETQNIVIEAEPGVYAYSSDRPGQREAGFQGTLRVVDQGTPTPCVPVAEFDPEIHECYEVEG